MLGQFDDFDQRAVGARAGEPHAVGGELLAVDVVELVAMAMPLGDLRRCRSSGRRCVPGSSRVGWAPSRIVPPLSVIVFCSSSRQITGCGVSLSNSVEWAPARPQTLRANSITAHCMPRQMPKNGMPFVAGVANRRDLAFDAALAETAGHEHAVVAGEQPLGAFALRRLRCGCGRCGPARGWRCRRGRALRRSTCRRRDARRTCRRRRC